MKTPYELPEVVDKDPSEIKAIIEQIKTSSMPDEMKNFVVKCVELALWLPIFLQNKAISLHRLRTMIFGKGYNKKDTTNPDEALNPLPPTHPTDPVEPTDPTDPTNPITPNESSAPVDNENTTTLDLITNNIAVTVITKTNDASNNSSVDAVAQTDPSDKKQGHGRMPHTVYTNAINIQLLLNLTIGDNCPFLCGGRLGPYKPGIIIRIKWQNFAQAYRYNVEMLRGDLQHLIYLNNVLMIS